MLMSSHAKTRPWNLQHEENHVHNVSRMVQNVVQSHAVTSQYVFWHALHVQQGSRYTNHTHVSCAVRQIIRAHGLVVPLQLPYYSKGQYYRAAVHATTLSIAPHKACHYTWREDSAQA
jgi:hypothetical protein